MHLNHRTRKNITGKHNVAWCFSSNPQWSVPSSHLDQLQPTLHPSDTISTSPMFLVSCRKAVLVSYTYTYNLFLKIMQDLLRQRFLSHRVLWYYKFIIYKFQLREVSTTEKMFHRVVCGVNCRWQVRAYNYLFNRSHIVRLCSCQTLPSVLLWALRDLGKGLYWSTANGTWS